MSGTGSGGEPSWLQLLGIAGLPTALAAVLGAWLSSFFTRRTEREKFAGGREDAAAARDRANRERFDAQTEAQFARVERERDRWEQRHAACEADARAAAERWARLRDEIEAERDAAEARADALMDRLRRTTWIAGELYHAANNARMIAETAEARAGRPEGSRPRAWGALPEVPPLSDAGE